MLLFWEWLFGKVLKSFWKYFLRKGCENEKFSLFFNLCRDCFLEGIFLLVCYGSFCYIFININYKLFECLDCRWECIVRIYFISFWSYFYFYGIFALVYYFYKFVSYIISCKWYGRKLVFFWSWWFFFCWFIYSNIKRFYWNSVLFRRRFIEGES